LQRCLAQAQGVPSARLAIATAGILVLSAVVFFVFPSLRTRHRPVAAGLRTR
jgi:hypothetical protein